MMKDYPKSPSIIKKRKKSKLGRIRNNWMDGIVKAVRDKVLEEKWTLCRKTMKKDYSRTFGSDVINWVSYVILTIVHWFYMK